MDNLLSKTEASKCIGIHPRTLERMIERGEGPARVCIGSRVLFRPAAVAQWIEGIERG